MKRRGQDVITEAGPEDFLGGGNRFRCVLLSWLVLNVLITLLCHLGQAELFGTCWVGHSWRKQLGLGYGCSGVPFKGRIFFLSFLQRETW